MLPLEKVRVADLTMVWAGPFATKLLADMGAEVIKVEGPKSFDLVRTLGVDSVTGRVTAEMQPYNRSAYFNEYNRNKLGISLDLSRDSGREVFLQLVACSDVVIENYRPDVMDKLGLSYDVLRKVRPDIIMVSMPGYAKRGKESTMVGYGPSIEQMSGLAALNGYENGPPQKTGISYGDPVAGSAAAAAVIAALIYRQQTGEGQYIEVSQRDCLISVIGEAIIGYQMTHTLPARTGNRHAWMAPHGCYPCKPLPPGQGRPLLPIFSAGRSEANDRWVTIAVRTDEEWRALCNVMERPDLASDPRFADSLSRWQHQAELDSIIADWTREQGDYEVAERLQAQGIPASPVLTPLALTENPHLVARGFFEEVNHPAMGTNKVTRPTWQLNRNPVHVRRPAPCFAQHNHEVMTELLGLSTSKLMGLEMQGVTSTAPTWQGSAV